MPGHNPEDYKLCISPQCPQMRKLICSNSCQPYHHRNHKILTLYEIEEFLNSFLITKQPLLHETINEALQQIEQLRIEFNKSLDHTIERIKHHFGRFWYQAQKYAQEFQFQQTPERIEQLAKQILEIATIKDEKLKIKIVKPLKQIGIHEILNDCIHKLETLSFTNDASSIKPENWVSSFTNHIRTITSDGEVWCLQPMKNELISGGDDNKITLWNLNTLQKIWQSKKHRSIITALTVTSDYKIVAMGSAAGYIKFWDLDTKKDLQKMKLHTDHVSSLHFSNDNSILLSSGWDCNLIQWIIDRKQISFKYFQKEHTQKIYRVQFNYDNKIIASCSLDKTIRLWDYQGLAQIGQPLCGHSEKVDWIQFSQQYLISSSQTEKLIIIWDYLHRQQVWNIQCEAHRFVLSPDGKLLACVRKDIRVYEIATRQQIGDTIPGHQYFSLSLTWSNRFLVSGCQDKTIRVYGIPIV